MKATTSSKLSIGGVLLAALLTACGGGNSGVGGLYATAPPAAVAPPANPALVPPDAPRAVDLVPPATPAQPGQPAQPVKTLNEQIAEAEGSGKYPKLDRSSDLEGPDADKNGVRDDIDAWINSRTVTEPQRKALIQKAKALQQSLVVDLSDKEALRRVGEALMASTNCGGDRFKPYAEYSRLRGRIEGMTANTRQRAERYMQYNKAQSGSSLTLPNHDTCES